MVKKTLIKYVIIVSAAAVIPVFITVCNEFSVVDVYNKVTQPYRGSDYDNLSVPDTSIVFKVLDINTGNPVRKVKIKLTKPNNDTLSRYTDKSGYAVFNFTKIPEGNYTVEASFNKNGKGYHTLENYYLHKNNNPLLVIYINEISMY